MKYTQNIETHPNIESDARSHTGIFRNGTRKETGLDRLTEVKNETNNKILFLSSVADRRG